MIICKIIDGNNCWYGKHYYFNYEYFFLYNSYFTPDGIGEPFVNREFPYINTFGMCHTIMDIPGTRTHDPSVASHEHRQCATTEDSNNNSTNNNNKSINFDPIVKIQVVLGSEKINLAS